MFWKRTKTPDFPTIDCDDKGFRLSRDQSVLQSIKWKQVIEIVAFKRDCFAHDVICLGFRIDETDCMVEVAEDFPGYPSFIKELERRFPLRDDWWRTVAFPAFETNLTSLWKHGHSESKRERKSHLH